MEKINILIRCHNHPELFKRCLDSIQSQKGAYIKIICSYDCECSYIPNWIEKIEVTPNFSKPYFYDEYINVLKYRVKSGYFFCLDEDDILAPDCLVKLPLTYPALLVQINHLGRVLPQDGRVQPGLIGFPNIILHHSLKHLIDVVAQDHADFHWIIGIAELIDLHFVPIVTVICDIKSNGQ